MDLKLEVEKLSNATFLPSSLLDHKTNILYLLIVDFTSLLIAEILRYQFTFSPFHKDRSHPQLYTKEIQQVVLEYHVGDMIFQLETLIKSIWFWSARASLRLLIDPVPHKLCLILLSTLISALP